MISLEEAQRRLLALAAPLAIETVSLAEAAGRWAAAPVIARRSQPAADLSAMDGYAIRHADLPGPWRVTGAIPAGAGAASAIGPGEAARIFTGAPLPPGADTVLMQEDIRVSGDDIDFLGASPAVGRHVRRAAMDFAEGATLIEAGTRLTAARIALAAVGGHGAITVRRPVRVALVSTGNELRVPGESGGLPASNAPMLAAMLADQPCIISDLGIVPDDLSQLQDVFAAAAEHDILVTTGGASVGDYDLVRPALLAAGATIDFWKVAMRPGKPLLAGRLGDCVALGLPGNPVSAFVTGTLFLRPLVARLGGAADPLPRRITAILGAALPDVGERTDFIRASWSYGRLLPVGGNDSAALSPLARADALIVRPAAAPAAAAGDMVEAIAVA